MSVSAALWRLRTSLEQGVSSIAVPRRYQQCPQRNYVPDGDRARMWQISRQQTDREERFVCHIIRCDVAVRREIHQHSNEDQAVVIAPHYHCTAQFTPWVSSDVFTWHQRACRWYNHVEEGKPCRETLGASLPWLCAPQPVTRLPAAPSSRPQKRRRPHMNLHQPSLSAAHCESQLWTVLVIL